MIEHEAKLQTNIDGIRFAAQKSNRAVKLAEVGNHERKFWKICKYLKEYKKALKSVWLLETSIGQLRLWSQDGVVLQESIRVFVEVELNVS